MNHFKNKLSKIFFIGIGGSGMSGIAEVLHNLGYEVSGSDISSSEVTERFYSMGIEVFIGHKSSNIAHAEMIVVSSAIDKNNPEIIEANKRSLPVLARAEMLSSLMNMKRGVAIAGTHGKTTTTSLVATILTEAKLDPTFINGGIVNSFATNAKLGKGEYLVAEADESDRSFLMLQPTISIITNIEEDHLINYDNSFKNLKQAFIDFVKKLPFNGLLIAFGDDLEINNLFSYFSRPKVTYGFNKDNDYVLSEYKAMGFQCNFILSWKEGSLLINLNMLGRHNALNASAACVLAIEEGVDKSIIQSSLANFMGINRRMQVLGAYEIEGFSTTLVDDYGHHPSEISNTIKSIREAHKNKKLTVVFQPHRYSRTKDLFNEFVEVLMAADELILLDVYSAGEEKILGCESLDILNKLKETSSIDVSLCSEHEEVISIVEKATSQRDGILLMQGAGNISSLSSSVYKYFSAVN